MAKSCFHCLEPIPEGFELAIDFNDEKQPVCCLGCHAVAEAIIGQGMTDYYKFRTESAGKVQELVPEQLKLFKSYDDADIQSEFLTEQGDFAELLLSIEGISCAACAWLIEKQLLKLGHVVRVDVNTSTFRASVKWDKTKLKLSEIIEALARIGYRAYPFQVDDEEQQKKETAKSYVRRLGVAGLMTMQVMMFAFAMYFGMFSGMDEDFEQYFRWISFVLATPVILYSALPFLTSAYRGLKAGQLNMDLPVSLAIFGAYGASSWATLFNTGEVYFESICMFTFLLLLGKYLEFRARLKASEFTANLQKLLPLTARLLRGQDEQIISAKKLQLNDIILVKAGETIPADGVIESGFTSVDEAMMTGEHKPVTKQQDDQVYAGTVNHDGVIQVKINQLGANTLLNQIVRLQHEALTKRPKIAEIADKIAQWFVAILLIFSAVTAFSWYHIEPEHAFWVTIAVLVATCPCALSLAIPTALTCAVANLTKRGVLIKQAHVLETLPKVSAIAFDKTGTLTEGHFTITQYQSLLKQFDDNQLLCFAKSLEQHSEHPIAKAFEELETPTLAVNDVLVTTGSGLTGVIDGQQIAIGKPNWLPHSQQLDFDVVLFVNGEPAMGFILADKQRAYLNELNESLQAANIKRYLLTGDPSSAGEKLADALNFDAVHIGCMPKQKQEIMEQFTSQGQITAMVGDGVNDSPVFNSAHLSIAMETGADISKNTADVVLLNSDLRGIKELFIVARKTKLVIRQNLAISLLYNGSILPLAAMGLVPPWVAVIGMTTSSLVVIGNSLRLLK